MFVLLHEDDIYGSLQGSLQHQGDELNEELDANFLLLSQYVGTLERKFEISIEFLIKLITSILDGPLQRSVDIVFQSVSSEYQTKYIYIDFLTHGVSQLYFNINSVLLFCPLLVATMPYISYKLLKVSMPHCQKNKIFKDNIMIYVKQK